MRLILVRHGVTDAAQGRVMGQSDIPLGALGAQQIDALIQRHSGPLPARLMSSDLKRARESAEMLAELINVPINCDPRLRELDFGRWEGASWGELPERDPECFQRWMDDWVTVGPPDGESFADLATRAHEWFEQQQDIWPEDEIVVAFTHAGVIRALLAHALGLPLHQAFSIRVDHGRASALRCRYGQFEVCYVNNPRLECDLFGD